MVSYHLDCVYFLKNTALYHTYAHHFQISWTINSDSLALKKLLGLTEQNMCFSVNVSFPGEAVRSHASLDSEIVHIHA